MKSTFTPKEVVSLVGISYRQLQYWDKTQFIRPSYRSHGKYRQYIFGDLIQLKLAKMLRDAEYSIQRLRTVIRQIRELLPQVSFPMAECSLLVEGDKILLFNGDMIMAGRDPARFVRFDARQLRSQIDALYPPQATPLEESGRSAAG